MPKTCPRPKLVIFDCDGVLIDSEPVFNAVLVQNLARHGLPLTPEQSQLTFTGLAMTELARMASQMGAMLPQNWITEVYDEAYARLRKGVPLIPGVLAVIRRLDEENTRRDRTPKSQVSGRKIDESSARARRWSIRAAPGLDLPSFSATTSHDAPAKSRSRMTSR